MAILEMLIIDKIDKGVAAVGPLEVVLDLGWIVAGLALGGGSERQLGDERQQSLQATTKEVLEVGYSEGATGVFELGGISVPGEGGRCIIVLMLFAIREEAAEF
jgi:hypothetical protein